jgi:hypothetical protein
VELDLSLLVLTASLVTLAECGHVRAYNTLPWRNEDLAACGTKCDSTGLQVISTSNWSDSPRLADPIANSFYPLCWVNAFCRLGISGSRGGKGPNDTVVASGHNSSMLSPARL